MQVYRGLPILTNQSAEPTRLVGIWPLDHEASVGEYAPLAHAAIDEILAAGRTPVVVGGTGLYLRAALAELALPPAPAPGARERWAAALRRGRRRRPRTTGWPRSTRRAAAAVHANDRRRVVRALELAEAGESLVPAEDRLWAGGTRHPTIVVGLDVPKAGARAPDRGAHARDVRRRRGGRGARALAGPISATARQDARSRRGRDAAARGGDRRARRPHAPLRGVPAQVDAARYRASLWSMPTARRARSPMRSSRWHAHGNVYLVDEGDSSGVDLSGTDGAVEVAARRRRRRRDRDREPRPLAAPRCPATERASPAAWLMERTGTRRGARPRRAAGRRGSPRRRGAVRVGHGRGRGGRARDASRASS